MPSIQYCRAFNEGSEEGMKIKSMHLAVVIIVFIFGTVAATSAFGLWKTTNDKVPAVYRDGEFAGQYNPADIKGSYTFEDIFNAFEIPIEDLGKAFNVSDPSKYASFQCKELEAIYAPLAAEGKEVGTGSVRYFVALYKGLPITVEEITYLPKTAVEILKTKANLTQEQIKSIEKYSVDLPVVPTSSTPSPQTTDKLASSKAITGSTTFKNLLDWGVKKEDIEKVLNDKIPDSGKIIKDYASIKGI
jgi:hypothetical protein